jgi:hypothetical protein
MVLEKRHGAHARTAVGVEQADPATRMCATAQREPPGRAWATLAKAAVPTPLGAAHDALELQPRGTSAAERRVRRVLGSTGFMTAKLRIAGGREWTPPDGAFDAVLDRVLARLTPGAALERDLHEQRRRGRAIELAADAVEPLLEAAYTAYVRLVRVWRAGFPDDGHDELVEHTGRLVRLLEAARGPVPLESWSIRRLQAFGGSIEASFPRELQHTLLPLVQADPALAERVLGVLRDQDLGEEATAIMGAAFLPAGRDDAFLLACARHRREEVRFHLFRLLARNRPLPDPGSLKATLAPDATLAIVQAGLADPSPRVRQRALAYAYGLGRVPGAEILRALASERDPDTRACALLALGLLDDPASLATLVHAFEQGEAAETHAAVWALARRSDGVARVLAAVEDARPEVRPEAIGAIMHVSAPLSDAQLAWLGAPERAPEARAAVQAYRRRRGQAASAFQVDATVRTR